MVTIQKSRISYSRVLTVSYCHKTKLYVKNNCDSMEIPLSETYLQLVGLWMQTGCYSLKCSPMGKSKNQSLLLSFSLGIGIRGSVVPPFHTKRFVT